MKVLKRIEKNTTPEKIDAKSILEISRRTHRRQLQSQ
jgi:hypothetical protein